MYGQQVIRASRRCFAVATRHVGWMTIGTLLAGLAVYPILLALRGHFSLTLATLVLGPTLGAFGGAALETRLRQKFFRIEQFKRKYLRRHECSGCGIVFASFQTQGHCANCNHRFSSAAASSERPARPTRRGRKAESPLAIQTEKIS
jgi:hypothetical protein